MILMFGKGEIEDFLEDRLQNFKRNKTKQKTSVTEMEIAEVRGIVSVVQDCSCNQIMSDQY